MQTGAMLFFHLFDRKNFSAKASELGEFLLNRLKPLLPLAVSNPRLRAIPALKPINPVQFLNLSDFCTETPYLFTENF
jgi:hypothetical protein